MDLDRPLVWQDRRAATRFGAGRVVGRRFAAPARSLGVS